LELSVSELNVFSSFALVAFWIHCLDGDDNWIEVISCIEQVLLPCSLCTISSLIVFAHVNDAKFFWHLLLKSLTELVCARRWHGLIGIKVERNVGSVSTFTSTDIDGDYALVVGVVLEVKYILEWIVFVKFYLWLEKE
jgi:hypothetical protein